MQSGVVLSDGTRTFRQFDPYRSDVDAGLILGVTIFVRATMFVGKLGNKSE